MSRATQTGRTITQPAATTTSPAKATPPTATLATVLAASPAVTELSTVGWTPPDNLIVSPWVEWTSPNVERITLGSDLERFAEVGAVEQPSASKTAIKQTAMCLT